jgi:hypothetical protein
MQSNNIRKYKTLEAIVLLSFYPYGTATWKHLRLMFGLAYGKLFPSSKLDHIFIFDEIIENLVESGHIRQLFPQQFDYELEPHYFERPLYCLRLRGSWQYFSIITKAKKFVSLWKSIVKSPAAPKNYFNRRPDVAKHMELAFGPILFFKETFDDLHFKKSKSGC